MIPDVKFIDEMIANFMVKSGDFSLRKQLLVLLGMSFMVTDHVIHVIACDKKPRQKR